MKQVRKVAKMWFSKTRDIVIETFTIVQRVDKNFAEHESKQDTQIDKLYTLIEECHKSCPEKDNFDKYTNDQNGTLLRMEKKYDTFFREHKQKIGKVEKKYNKELLNTNLEVAKVKEIVGDIKTVKKCKREIIADWIKYVAIFCVITGTVIGFLKYQDSQKQADSKKIEKILEEILKK